MTEVLPGQDCPQQSADGPLVAVAATIGATDFSIPSNIWFFDVSNPDQPVRVGAMSATTSATQDGSLMRIFMKGQFVYASTFNKGLQVIDAQQAITEFQQTPPDQFGGAITTDGNGFALDAVVNTIPVPIKEASGAIVPAVLYDVKAADYATGQPDPNAPSSAPVPTQTLIVATGNLPFVVADPQQGGIGAVIYPARDVSGTALSQVALLDGVSGQFELQQGRAVALGDIPVTDLLGVTTNTPIAVVVGTGTSTAGGTSATPASLLAVVDMSNAKVPNPRGFVALVDGAGSPVQPVDVILKDDLAFVGTSAKKVLLVNLDDPNRPTLAGEIDGLFGDRLALTDQGIILTTSPNSAIGGIHAASLGNPCATYRDLIKTHPPSSVVISSLPQLSWKMSGGLDVTPEGVELNRDGLVLTNVMLGRRQLAKTMSLPYFLLQRSNDADPTQPPRCELLHDASQNACSQLASARSQLLKFSANPSDGTSFKYEAQFLIDRLDGDPEVNPEIPDSCVVLTQQYEFRKEGLIPLEPFGKFPSAKFLPIVKYSYFTDPGGPQLKALTTAQRLHFDARTPNPPDQNPPITASLKAAANAILLSCDPDPVNFSVRCLPNIFLGVDSDLGSLGATNPTLTEKYLRIIENGVMKIFPDPDRNGTLTVVDNYHQTPTPKDNPNQAIDEPGATTFGCPACVHIHWRWTSLLNCSVNPLVDCAFDNNKGSPFLPPDPTQDVDIAVLRSGDVSEQHPDSVLRLFQLQTSQAPVGPNILPQDLINTGTTPVFWYIATGHKTSDKFFIHGGGFGTFYVNRMTMPGAGGGPIGLNIEHTRDLNYEIEMIRTDIDASANPKNPSVTLVQSTLTGVLHAGTDDVTGNPDMIWGPLTGDLKIKVTLIDTTLSPKNTWERTFEFFSGTTTTIQEP